MEKMDILITELETLIAGLKKPNQIIRYSNCDFIGKNCVSKYGFDKTKTEDEMIALAILHKCPIILKNGPNAKWYLKGAGKTQAELTAKLEENVEKGRIGQYCLYLNI